MPDIYMVRGDMRILALTNDTVYVLYGKKEEISYDH